LEQLGINPIFLLSQIVNFLILAILLRVFAYKPILNVLDKRRERIEQGLEDARLAEEARANAESERQKILDGARVEAQGIVAEANQRGEAQAAQIVGEAQAQAGTILDEARAEAQAERDRMLDEMRGQIAALSIAAANQLIGEALDERRQMQLVAEFFSGVKDGKIRVAEKAGALSQRGAARAGEKAVITSALPLSEDDQATYHSYLQSQLGADTTVEFKTDPTILGGVVLRVGDVVVDDSVAGKLGALRQSLG
jgi:F-type H+-transporting ATPase subunit b